LGVTNEKGFTALRTRTRREKAAFEISSDAMKTRRRTHTTVSHATWMVLSGRGRRWQWTCQRSSPFQNQVQNQDTSRLKKREFCCRGLETATAPNVRPAASNIRHPRLFRKARMPQPHDVGALFGSSPGFRTIVKGARYSEKINQKRRQQPHCNLPCSCTVAQIGPDYLDRRNCRTGS